MRRTITLTSALVLMGVLALAPVASAQEPIEVKLWFHGGVGAESDALNAQVAAFNDSQSEIVVNVTEIPGGAIAGSGYNDAVNAAAVAGDLPCILDLDGPNLYNYAWGGFLLALDDMMSDDLRDDLLPSLIDQGTYNGQMYAIGQYDSGLAIVGRRSLLDEAGVRIPSGIDDAWTFEEFNEALQKVQALESVEFGLDLKLNYGAGEWFTYGFSPFVQGFGGDLINRDDYASADGVVNGPESVAALTWLQDLVQDGVVNATPADDNDFVNGKAGLGLVGHWMTADYYAAFGDDMVIIPMPDFGTRQATGMGSWAWSVTTQCTQPEAAWTFMEYLLGPDQILEITDTNGAVPGRFSALERSELYGEGGRLNVFVQQLEGGVAVPRPITPAYPAITTSFYQAVDDILKGADVQTELDAVADAIEADIEANGGYSPVQ
ncbi:MAG: sugar ABC transporter substrate-binding protein [Chloroflexota bacterium]